MMRELIYWLTHTPVNHLVMDYRWTWPTAESLHFCALALMVGTVGTFFQCSTGHFRVRACPGGIRCARRVSGLTIAPAGACSGVTGSPAW